MDDDLRSLRDMDPDEEEDLFAGFSDDPLDLEEIEDPFASLDELAKTDPFATLEARKEEDIFAQPEEPLASPVEPALDIEPLPGESETPDWLRELGVGTEELGFDRPAPPPAQPAGKGTPLTALTGTGPSGMALGMTAQQRMVLAIFMFLDVLVLGILVLFVVGAINI